MSDFRYAIGFAALGDPIGDDDGAEAAEVMGDAVLAMPEMQAVREALHLKFVIPYEDTLSRKWAQSITITRMEEAGLPPSVVAWVIGEEQ